MPAEPAANPPAPAAPLPAPAAAAAAAEPVVQLPPYCTHYKPLIVENFSLIETPFQLHYGKCSLIGRTALHPDTHRIYLTSVRLVGLPPDYQCPDGTTQVLLHTSAGCTRDLPANETVRVYGEATFYDRDAATTCADYEEDVVLITTKELLQMARTRAAENGTSVRSQEDAMRLRYEPCVTVHSFNALDQPNELVQLEQRLAALRRQTRQ